MISSKRELNLIESDRGRYFFNILFQDFSNKNNIKIDSRNTDLGAAFAERINRTKKDLLKKSFLNKAMQYGLIFYLQ